MFRRNRCLSPSAQKGTGTDCFAAGASPCPAGTGACPRPPKKGQAPTASQPEPVPAPQEQVPVPVCPKRDRHRLLRSRSQSLPRHIPTQKAKLLARIGEHFPLECPTCGGDIRLIAFITEPAPIKKILTHLGDPLEPPPVAPARGPPTDWGELVQTHDDRDVVQATPDEVPVIDIHSL